MQREGRITVSALTVVQGIDVSQWQGSFDWQQWFGKVGFAMAKAVDGDDGTDPYFGHNWDSMWWLDPDHRLPRFAYLYFHASLDPVIQAAHLVATVRGHGLLPGDNFVVDIEETVPGSGENDGIPAAECAPLAIQCLREVNRLAPGHRVLPYMNPSWAQAGGSAGMASWFLWLASYGIPAPVAPPPWDRATFWQFSDQPVDGDRFMGTEDELLAFTRMPAKR
jgi:GH25 family lysozyme M1 (1,4-beta-N-acetylmuramidase)